MSYATAHALYSSVTDLPELVSDDELVSLPSRDIAAILDAVEAREQAGATRIQEKVDGCWCALHVGASGRILSATARSGLPLRMAVEWVDKGERHRRLGYRWGGWTIIGECEAGTKRAGERREQREQSGNYGPPPFHVFAVVAPNGDCYQGHRDVADLLYRMLPGANATSHWHRMRPVREPNPGESWRSFAERIFAEGGEGVILHDDGVLYRAKPVIDADRVVLKVVTEKDRNGTARPKALVGYCFCWGKRPQFRISQKVQVPRGTQRMLKRGTVVTVVSSHIDRKTGVVRHGRIAEIRQPEDKLATECRR